MKGRREREREKETKGLAEAPCCGTGAAREWACVDAERASWRRCASLAALDLECKPESSVREREQC